MEFNLRERRMVFATDGEPPRRLLNALKNRLIEALTISYVAGNSNAVKIKPKIILRHNRELAEPSTLSGICDETHQVFYCNQADFVITVTLGWGNSSYGSNKPGIAVYQINAAGVSSGRRIYAYLDISDMFGDKEKYLQEYHQNPWNAPCVLEKLPQKLEDALRHSFPIHHQLVGNCQLVPIRDV